MARISPTNRRFVIAYILLVGVPVLGLAGVLRSGRGMNAPMSVDGVWKFAADSAPLPSGKCSQELASLQDSLLTISRSGKELTLNFKNASTIGSGVIEGNIVNATVPLVATSTRNPDCETPNAVTLHAEVDPKSEPRSMQATISFGPCNSCSRMQFQAVRKTHALKGGAQ